MKLKAFSVFDEKAQAYVAPFFMPEMAMAARVFGDAINNPEHDFGRHPEDYTLFLIGEFDVLTGTISPHERGVSLMLNGVQARRPVANGNGKE